MSELTSEASTIVAYGSLIQIIQLTFVQHTSLSELGALALKIACSRYLILFEEYLGLTRQGSLGVEVAKERLCERKVMDKRGDDRTSEGRGRRRDLRGW
jgi:hypothetical protein